MGIEQHNVSKVLSTMPGIQLVLRKVAIIIIQKPEIPANRITTKKVHRWILRFSGKCPYWWHDLTEGMITSIKHIQTLLGLNLLAPSLLLPAKGFPWMNLYFQQLDVILGAYKTLKSYFKMLNSKEAIRNYMDFFFYLSS